MYGDFQKEKATILKDLDNRWLFLLPTLLCNEHNGVFK
jgi:hypothetical protein